MKPFFSAFLLIGIALLGGCAKTTTVLFPLAPEDSDLYRGEKSILVVLKTAEVYEIEHFVVRGDSLVGTRVFRSESGAKKGEQKTALALNEISTIQLAKTSGRDAMFFQTGCGFAIGTAAVVTIIIIAILGAIQPWD